MRIGFIVVLYQTPENEINRIEDEILKLGFKDLKIYFIENTKENRGYGGGINEGIRMAQEDNCELIIAANPDITLSRLKAKEILAGGKYFDIWGLAMIQQGQVFYGGKLDSVRLTGGLNPQKPKKRFQKTDWISGSFLIFKTKVINKIGLFAEKYFMYYEDVDFCQRARQKGYELVKNNIGKVFSESEGAVIYEGSKAGLHDRVFITSRNTPTYEAKDVCLEILKYEEFPYDKLIITTASEQNEYFKVIFSAIEKVMPELKGKLEHIGFGMVNLKSGKMASRTGEIIGAVDLVDMVVAEIRKIVEDRKDLSEAEKEEIAESVGIGAVKYSFLKNSPLKDTKFDIKESISKEGNSGPYLQYTYARTQSVLEKAKKPSTANSLQITEKQKTVDSSLSALSLNEEELNILRSLLHFPEAVEASAISYSPNLICNYVYDLAQKYNTFYNKHDILEQRTKDKKVSEYRLSLTKAVGIVIENSLKLLGIKTLLKM